MRQVISLPDHKQRDVNRIKAEMEEVVRNRSLGVAGRIYKLGSLKSELIKYGLSVTDVDPCESNDFSYFELIPLEE